MNKEEFVKEIRAIEDIQSEYDELNRELSTIFGSDSTAENGFLPLFYKMRDRAIKYISLIVDDSDGWIMWYFDEVVGSVDGMDCTPHKDAEKANCKNAYDLWDIIQIANN